MSRLLDGIRQAAQARSERREAASAEAAASDGKRVAGAGQSLLVQAMQRNAALQEANPVGTQNLAAESAPAESAPAESTRGSGSGIRQAVFVAVVAATIAFGAGYWTGRPAPTATVSAPLTPSPSGLQLRLDRDIAGVARRLDAGGKARR